MLYFVNVGKSQTTPFCDTCIIKKANQRIYLVIKEKGMVDRTTSDFIINIKLIEKFSLLSKEEFHKTHTDIEEKDCFGATLTLNQGVKFLNLSQIFDKFNIAGEYRNYPVLIDREETQDPETLLAEESMVEKVVINKVEKNVEIISTEYIKKVKERKRLHDSKIIMLR